MRYQFFTIPVLDPDTPAEQLNAFLASHVIVDVDRQLVTTAAGQLWTVCVVYLPAGEAAKPTTSPQKTRIDYREVLSEADFAVFARLRDLRKSLSQSQRVPAYTLFNNEHLAAMVQQRVTTKAALAKIDGVGEARIAKYGDAFLRILIDAYGAGEYRNWNDPSKRNSNIGFRLSRAHRGRGCAADDPASILSVRFGGRRKPNGPRCVSSVDVDARRGSSPVARPFVRSAT